MHLQQGWRELVGGVQVVGVVVIRRASMPRLRNVRHLAWINAVSGVRPGALLLKKPHISVIEKASWT